MEYKQLSELLTTSIQYSNSMVSHGLPHLLVLIHVALLAMQFDLGMEQTQQGTPTFSFTCNEI